MKRIAVGILAHVDAGKTTLAEAMLYRCGELRTIGRVDRGDAFLDTHTLEKTRGITIFSKQAVMELPGISITLLDTPGHVDFSAEMERTLQILDYAILVINGSDGIQSHTLTLWKLLKSYQIPVILFVNKMDQPGNERHILLEELKGRLAEGIVDFGAEQETVMEEAALCDEEALEQWTDTGRIEEKLLADLIRRRLLFPCLFGAALKLEGVEELLLVLQTFTGMQDQGEAANSPGEMLRESEEEPLLARAFKITRDEQGNRLTHLKILRGRLKVKDQLPVSTGEEPEEKVNQIRIYSGAKYETVSQAQAGAVCAVTGPVHTRPGQSFGEKRKKTEAALIPVLTYRMILPKQCDPVIMLAKMRLLEEEQPELKVEWTEESKEIQVQIMGEIQLEIVASLIQERFQVQVSFDTGHILYRETIRESVIGSGHFEPLRHYAEVHLRLEAGEAGRGLVCATQCSEDRLDRNWQRLILSHLQEREHRGILTGSPITDMKLTLVAGRAHLKHTEGGDFRQAVYRALRQGLMQADTVLLEPYYEFTLEVPEKMTGRAMSDLERMHASFEAPEFDPPIAKLSGSAPVATMQNYSGEVISYTKGLGRLSCSFLGYFPCHNAEEVIRERGYDPLTDPEYPPGSVFCKKGAGFYVEWNDVSEYMHLEPEKEWMSGGAFGESGGGDPEKGDPQRRNGAASDRTQKKGSERKLSIGEDEITEIYQKTFYANSNNKALYYRDNPKIGAGRNRAGSSAAGSSATGSIAAGSSTEKNSAAGSFGTKTGGAGNSAAGGTEPSLKEYEQSVQKRKEEYLLVDGYNIIFAWKELKELAAVNLDSARGSLLDQLCNYQAICKVNLIVVFDAYKVPGNREKIEQYHNITVVYTKEAETADRYIERFAHVNGGGCEITVATSDATEQIIIMGQGCRLLSAGELEREVRRLGEQILSEYSRKQKNKKHFLMDYFPD